MVRFGSDGFPLWDSDTSPYDYGLPRDMDRPAIPVTLVCGPPASGKTYHVATHKEPGDIVIDLDDIKVRVGGKHWDTCPDVFKMAITERNKMLCDLSTSSQRRAWVIYTGERRQAREEWARRLGAESIVMIDTPEDLCIKRIKQDDRRKYAAASQIRAVRSWHEYN